MTPPIRMVSVPVADLEEVRDLLMERRQGHPARSPAHNARLCVDAMLTAAPVRKEGGAVDDAMVEAACSRFVSESDDIWSGSVWPEGPDDDGDRGDGGRVRLISEGDQHNIRAAMRFALTDALAIREEAPAEAGEWIKRAMRFIDLCDADAADYQDREMHEDAADLIREGFALFDMDDETSIADLRHAALRAQPQAREEGDETYDIGKRDGYEQAVQDIDLLTGGDGEYVFATDGGGCPDVETMKARIVERVQAREEAQPVGPDAQTANGRLVHAIDLIAKGLYLARGGTGAAYKVEGGEGPSVYGGGRVHRRINEVRGEAFRVVTAWRKADPFTPPTQPLAEGADAEKLRVAVEALEGAVWSLASFGQLADDDEGGNTEGLDDEKVVRMFFSDPEYDGEDTLLGELFIRAFRKAKVATNDARQALAALQQEGR